MKLRNFITVALVVGVAVGVWLGGVWKGPGKGPGLGERPGGKAVSSPEGDTAVVSHVTDRPASSRAESLRVIIRDRSYYLKRDDGEVPTSLDALVDLVKGLPGDDDGLRLRVYRAEDARVTADVELREALQHADVPDAAVFWSPDLVP